MGIQLPGAAVSIGLVALLVIAAIIITGHCTAGIGGHLDLGVH